MGRLDLKNLHQKNDGRLYFHRKVRGKDVYIRLTAADDPRFAEAYQRAAYPAVVRAAPGRGTIGALCVEFKSSAEGKSGKARPSAIAGATLTSSGLSTATAP